VLAIQLQLLVVDTEVLWRDIHLHCRASRTRDTFWTVRFRRQNWTAKWWK
jgi:hypothetical protein